MSKKKYFINFDEAKSFAEIAFNEKFSRCGIDYTVAILSDEFLDEEYCWIFFRNMEIRIPEELLLSVDYACAVSKYTKGMQDIFDFRKNSEQMEEYAKLISDYFKCDRKPTKTLRDKMDVFILKYRNS